MTETKNYKSKIEAFNTSLHDDYLNQTSSLKLVQKRSRFIDKVLEELWAQHFQCAEQAFSLAAVGGYGRGELHPYSDIDLLFLHQSPLSKQDERCVSLFLRTLWDCGLEPGYSIRTIDECFVQAENDVTVMTNLLESRFLCGDETLFNAFSKAFKETELWPVTQFIEAKLAEQNKRHQRYDHTEENLEPNIKDNPGGLRDIQTIFWIIKRYQNTLKNADDVQLISNEELQSIKRCRNFLWKLRFGLHYIRHRKEERLLFENQQKLAKELDFGENQEGIERLMKKYYRVTKEVRVLNEILIQQIRELADTRPVTVRKISRYFSVTNDQIHINKPEVFNKHPHTILELFFLMQLNPDIKGIDSKTLRKLRTCLTFIDKDFRNNERCKQLFLEIVSYHEGQSHALRRMNTYGVLGAYIPDFGKIVGQMQHDLFHIYTVDAHTLIVVRNLRRFCILQHQEEYPDQYEIMQTVSNKRILFLAGLFHDIGKGRNEDHSVIGEKITLSFCKKINLPDHETSIIAWLVRYHLLMSSIAQGEDISNPKVVLNFAKKVGDLKRLNYLYLLTCADIMGTSNKLWTRWKGSLLLKLYNSAKTVLTHEAVEPEEVFKRVNEIHQSVFNEYQIDVKTRAEYKYLWSMIDDHYFFRFNPSTLNWHAANIVWSPASALPVVACGYREDIDSNELFIYTAETEELLSTVTLIIDYLDFSIVSAHIMRLKNGMSLLHFVINPTTGKNITEEKALQKIAAEIKKYICVDKKQLPKLKVRRLQRRIQHFSTEDKIFFTQSDNGQFTILSVYTQDKPGLLHKVCAAMNACKIELHSARINTLGERVEDHFFITNRDNEPITDEEMQNSITESVLDHIHDRAKN